MEASSTTMVQDMDILMQSSEPHISNGSTNGFVDPRVLRIEELPESSDSRTESPDSESRTEIISPRKSYLPTGCCYDARMRLHANADFSGSPHHPEDPKRIEAIMDTFQAAGLIYGGTRAELESILKTSPLHYMYRIDARSALKDEICTVHTSAHYNWVKSLTQMTPEELRKLTSDFDNGRKSLYVGSLTYEAALISAGGAIETCKAVVTGTVKNAIAVIRPPGHHAEHDESLGFCIFNNVPIAAKVCLMDYPDVCRKILILDWDVHHGNGIQNMFYDDPNVLYISLHVYQNGAFYPGQPDDPDLPDGGLDKCGRGLGIGRNVNIGWQDQGVGDGEYFAAFQKIVMPIAYEFDPDLVIISAGFDAAAGDELGGCYVSPACYSQMTHMLMSLANGKVAVCLEGGYNLQAISRSALAVAKTLMGEPPERMIVPNINHTAADTLSNVKRIQANYWECMRSGVIVQEDIRARQVERLSSVIWRAHSSKLNKEYDMIPLKILRKGLTEPFENQVLVTPELFKAKRVLVIIHDPPEVLAQPDLHDNKVYPHNAYVANDIKPYIDWAIENGFAVMDVCLPQQLPKHDGAEYIDSYTPKSSEQVVTMQCKELIVYLWDNWLELIGNTSVTLMGVGDANLGIKQLLQSKDLIRYRIPAVVSFIDTSLRTVKSETDPNLSSWYRSSALIVVVPDHTCFNDPEQTRKVTKNRFGKVLRAQIDVGNGGNPIGRMLRAHERDAQKWILDKVGEWERNNPDPDETEDEVEIGNGNDGEIEGGGEEKGEDVVMGSGVEGVNVEDEEMVMGGMAEIVSSRMPIVS